MNKPLDERMAAYKELAVFLEHSIQKGLIPKKHMETVDTLINMEQSGVLQAVEALRRIPEDHPLHQIYASFASAKPYTPILLSNPPNPMLTFKHYVNSSINKLSYKLADSIAKGTSDIFFGVLFIYGDTGQGKTHLLSAIANEMMGHNNNAPFKDALLMRVSDFEMELNGAGQIGKILDVYSWILQHNAILVDDVQDAAGNFGIQKELVSIIKSANIRRIPVVLTANCPVEELANIDSNLQQLIAGGVTAELRLPHHEHLGVIAQNVAGDVHLPKEVIDYLSDNITDNVRHLVSSVQQIVALNKQTDTEITVDLARAVAPMENDMRSTIPLLEPEHSAIYNKDFTAVKNVPGHNEPQRKADIFKEMLASAQNEEEQCLALQIAISEKIKELRKEGNHEEVAKLKTALEHLRAGEIREALICTSL